MGCLAIIGGMFVFCFLYTISPSWAFVFIVFLIGYAIGKKK